MGGKSLILTYAILFQEIGDNREHAWKMGGGAGYPNIWMGMSQISRYLVKFDIFLNILENWRS